MQVHQYIHKHTNTDGNLFLIFLKYILIESNEMKMSCPQNKVFQKQSDSIVEFSRKINSACASTDRSQQNYLLFP